MSFFKRTFKVLICMNMNIPIVSFDWLFKYKENVHLNKNYLDYFIQKKNNLEDTNNLKEAFKRRKKENKNIFTDCLIISIIN